MESGRSHGNDHDRSVRQLIRLNPFLESGRSHYFAALSGACPTCGSQSFRESGRSLNRVFKMKVIQKVSIPSWNQVVLIDHRRHRVSPRGLLSQSLHGIRSFSKTGYPNKTLYQGVCLIPHGISRSHLVAFQ
jgi:hypothetical protein